MIKSEAFEVVVNGSVVFRSQCCLVGSGFVAVIKKDVLKFTFEFDMVCPLVSGN